MTSIITLATILLLAHFGSEYYIFTVIRKQWALMKIPIYPEVKRFRHILFTLSLVIFFGNFIPILIDALTLFVDTGRPRQVRLVSVLYALSNALVALVSAYLIHTLYKLAADTKVRSDNTLKAAKKKGTK